MPVNSKVHRCVEKLKGKNGINPFAVCQKSTGQSFSTGRSIKRKRRRIVPKANRHGYY